MEAIFLKLIRDEPGNPTHPLVYADWLEEQGDPKGRLVRLWQRGVHGKADDRAAAREELGQGLSGLKAVVEQLTKPQQQLLACDCAERTLWLLEEDLVRNCLLREGLEAARRFARGEIPETEMTDTIAALHHRQTAHVGNRYFDLYLPAIDAIHAVMSAMRGAWGTALHSSQLALDDDPAYFRTGRYVQADAIAPAERGCQLLIALSYHLFDHNCCPADLRQ